MTFVGATLAVALYNKKVAVPIFSEKNGAGASPAPTGWSPDRRCVVVQLRIPHHIDGQDIRTEQAAAHGRCLRGAREPRRSLPALIRRDT